MSQGDDEFDGAYDEFKEARTEENAFNTARSEESVTREHSLRARNMAGYATGTANEPKEEEEEENAEGNRKQLATNPIGGSHGWAKESAARARPERAGNLDGYATGIGNNPKEDE